MPILVGIVVGALAGFFVYPQIKMRFDNPESELMRGKTEARLSVEGTYAGTWLGAATGAVIGITRLVMTTRRRKAA